MAMGTGPRGTMLSEINVTPLVDVMLVLLIIFMITAPLTMEGVQVSVPEAAARPMEKKEGTPRVSITESGAVHFDKRKVAQLDLGQPLYKGKNLTELDNITVTAKRDPRLHTGKEVYIDAHHKLPYGTVVNVMVKLQLAGVTKLGLVTRPPEVE